LRLGLFNLMSRDLGTSISSRASVTAMCRGKLYSYQNSPGASAETMCVVVRYSSRSPGRSPDTVTWRWRKSLYMGAERRISGARSWAVAAEVSMTCPSGLRTLT